ncbi:MAG: hypothetical protein ACM31L_06955 [Actinomycetota bacterium]
MVEAPRDDALQSFPTIAAIDTCSVWNILCSRTLTLAMKRQNRHFVLAEYVRYECLSKPRRTITAADQVMRSTLEAEIKAGQHFSTYSVGVEDLRDLLANVGSLRNFHRGEVAALALARKLGNGFMTDDRTARMVGERALGHSRVRTTPHLVGWLLYIGQLGDGDIRPIVADNDAYRQTHGKLGPFIQKCYETAMSLRLREALQSQTAPLD